MDLIERLRLLEQDHEPDGWPAVRMRDITAILDALEAAREDSDRYRWLRDIPSQLRADHDHNPASGGWDAPIFWHGLSKPGDELQGRDLDIAIDQARGKGVAE